MHHHNTAEQAIHTFKKSLHRRVGNNRQEFPNETMGPPVGTSTTHLEFITTVTISVTGASVEYRHLIRNPATKDIWEHSCANEFRRLAQGIRDIKGTDTITFIHISKIPKGCRATYP
jgi:hypothetical protein